MRVRGAGSRVPGHQYGPLATAGDIRMHINAARQQVRLRGLLGSFDELMDRWTIWTGEHGVPKKGSKAWEARYELEKLPDVIKQRKFELSHPDLTVAEREQMVFELRDLHEQLAKHERAFETFDQSPGQGFIAATGDKTGAIPAETTVKAEPEIEATTKPEPKKAGEVEAVGESKAPQPESAEVTVKVEPSEVAAPEKGAEVETVKGPEMPDRGIDYADKLRNNPESFSTRQLTETESPLGRDYPGRAEQVGETWAEHERIYRRVRVKDSNGRVVTDDRGRVLDYEEIYSEKKTWVMRGSESVRKGAEAEVAGRFQALKEVNYGKDGIVFAVQNKSGHGFDLVIVDLKDPNDPEAPRAGHQE